MEISDLKTIVTIKSVSLRGEEKTELFPAPPGNASQAFLERRRERVDFEPHHLMISRCLSFRECAAGKDLVGSK